MAYRLYSKLPGQDRFYATDFKTLVQFPKGQRDVGLIWDYFKALEMLRTVEKACSIPGTLFEVRKV